MSERCAQSCNGKVRHPSMRKAEEIAKKTQEAVGTPMKGYHCFFCKSFHVGTVEVLSEEDTTRPRFERKQEFINHRYYRGHKRMFQKGRRK